MTALDTLIDPLKRELAVPGDFDTIFPNTLDGDLLASLGDAFGEAQLDGYFPAVTLDLDTYLLTPDVSTAGGALLIIYAGMRIIRSQMRAINLVEKYAAGSASYEVQRSSTLLREELKYLEQRKTDLLNQTRSSQGVTYVYDSYFARSSVAWESVGPLTLAEIG